MQSGAALHLKGGIYADIRTDSDYSDYVRLYNDLSHSSQPHRSTFMPPRGLHDLVWRHMPWGGGPTVRRLAVLVLVQYTAVQVQEDLGVTPPGTRRSFFPCSSFLLDTVLYSTVQYRYEKNCRQFRRQSTVRVQVYIRARIVRVVRPYLEPPWAYRTM